MESTCLICRGKFDMTDIPDWRTDLVGVCDSCRADARIGKAVRGMQSGERLAQVAGEYTVFDDGMTGAVGWHKDPADALAEIRRMKGEK